MSAMANETITVATYNIQGGKEHRAQSRVLSDINPDVVLLQEVGGKNDENAHCYAIAATLDMCCEFRTAHTGTKGILGNAILSKFPLSDVQELMLPPGSSQRDNGTRMPGKGEKRNMIAATVSPTDDRSDDFWCLSTHLGIYNSKDTDYGRATNGPAQIGVFMNHATRTGTPAILGGDLNVWYKHGEPASKQEPVLRRFDRNWNIYAPDGPTFVKNPNATIDYILERNRGMWKMEKVDVFTGGEAKTASDHFPVVAVWRRRLLKP